ncbi:MAG TPA: SDR family oxidoreductase [Solirubrobacter sp.]|nr:SDR family oxidoreductase [Solirubrobacter sp.]
MALITGTGGGQGRAAAELFCAEGASVVGCDVNAAENARTVDLVKAGGGEIVGMAPVDLGDSQEARRWVAEAAAVHGRFDVLFNNAAAPRFAPIAELSDEDWHFTMRNELDLIFFVTQASWPHLIDAGGVIINTASVQGLVGIVMNGGLAHRANSISPGTIATQATARLVADEQLLNSILAPLLIKRLGEPVDVAALAVYLPPTSRPTSRARTSWSTEG